MSKKLSYILVGLTLSLLSTSCGDNKPVDGRTDTYSSGAITFASDESFSPIIEEEIQIFESIYKEAKVTPVYTSESDAMNLLLSDSLWLVITARDFKAEELKNLQDRHRRPMSIKLAYDGLAVIQNRENLDSCICIDDIAKILNGTAKNWSDIYPDSKRGEIILVFDNKKSSAVHFAEDSILGGKPIVSPNVVATENTSEVIEYVARTPNAIGIIGSNHLNDKSDTTNVTLNKTIRTMLVSKYAPATLSNSWRPYQYYLYNGNYPLIRTVYALLNDPLHALPWGFAQFIASPKGQLIIFKSGMLPVQGNMTVRDVKITQ